ncbi:MAG: ABC transporter permease [Clostridiaceae bacterium]|nr:ABC transporter permease [Clostridiaceae bacterium]
MKKYIFRRFLQVLLVILGATFLTFTLTYISPGDAAEILLTAHDTVPTEEVLERTREEMGLNDPFMLQYGRWLKGLSQGDLGISYRAKVPVMDVLAQRIPMTVKLSITALCFLVFFSLLLGILSAIYQNRFFDYIIRLLSFFGISIPSFWLGLLLIYWFVVKMRYFTITNPNELKSILLPAITLTIPLVGRYTRQIRASVLEELSQDYVLGARARGTKEIKIIFQHVLPNAIIGIITLFGMSIAALLSGTVIVENVFLWPGLGSMALEAIEYRDYPLLQGYVIFMSIVYVALNFVVEIVTQYLDPRVTIGAERKIK